MSASLPTGTVTFLFTDIEGSTRLLEELGPERYSESLAEHRRIMRSAFGSQGGVEVDTQGDAFFVAFPDADGALAAAARAQAELAEGAVRVRMGIHSGAPLLTTEGYVGMDVHQGARVMSAGHGGQVLVSDATRGLLDGGEGLTDLGLHRLKDLTEPQRLWQLGDAEFPPLKTLFQTNLPVQPTPLIGREEELAEVLDLLGRERLVTLTGPGGAGKTRLALQAAAELADDFRDGVWWVSLAALRDHGLVDPTIGQVLGVRGDLVDAVREKQALLLLDNFEHVVGAAPAVADLLARAPDLRVLVTSRERLAVAAEHEYSVPPLDRSDAVALFTARARQLKADFEPDDAVAKIAERLDGLPLALELAAARIKVLRTDQILERVDRSLEMLTSGHRDAPERHQTLRATIEWSYDLLDGDEQLLFARLAVFAGSFSLEAAEQVCDADVDTLAALVDKSLVRSTGESRFFLLETIREFAGECLHASGRRDELQRRHLEFFNELGARAADEFFERGKASTAIHFVSERENFRAALTTAAAIGAWDALAELAASVAARWVWIGGLPEARKWLELALVNASEEPSIRVAILRRRLGDAAFAEGDLDESDRLHHAALTVFQANGDARNAAGSLVRLAQAALLRGDATLAEQHAEELARTARSAGLQRSETIAQSLHANVAFVMGDYARARRLYATSIRRFRAQDEDGSLALDLVSLAFAELLDGEDTRAAANVREALAILQPMGEVFALVGGLEIVAALLVRRGKPEHAAALLATIEESTRLHGFVLQPEEARLHAESKAAVDDRVDPDVEPLGLDEAISLAVASLD